MYYALKKQIQQLRARLVGLETRGPSVLVAPSTNSILKGWINSLSYTSATRDVDGVITTATVAWPDGSAGTYTVTTKNAIWLRVDAYTVTHTSSGKTVTQAAVTRDANGNITAQPALTIAP